METHSDKEQAAVQRCKRLSRRAMVATAVFLLTTVFIHPAIVILAVLSAIAAVGTSIEAARHNRRTPPEGDGQPRRRRTWPTAAVASVLLVGSIAMALTCLSMVRETSKSTISAANLRGIWCGLRNYHEEYASYPDSLHELILAGISCPTQCFCPFDPQAWAPRLNEADYLRPDAEGLYFSYIYQPGRGEWRTDPDVILAYERGPFSRRMQFTDAYGHFVLFRDGSVRWLTPSELTEARRTDAARRRELGWPETGE